jgi:O-acetyl-ADP-ribose deacetylase (regulator of RNase III)
MTDIQYVTGDATQPAGAGGKIIAHVCNDAGKWGSGFVLALSRRWPQPEAAYRQWSDRPDDPLLGDFALGGVQYVLVEYGLTAPVWVANMIAQRGIRRGSDGQPPIRYGALEETLCQVGGTALAAQCSVHLPRIGCGLAGGDWDHVEPLIRKQLCDRGVPVTVYDLPHRQEQHEARLRASSGRGV